MTYFSSSLAASFISRSVHHVYGNVITHLIQLERINYKARHSLHIKVVEYLHISTGIYIIEHALNVLMRYEYFLSKYVHGYEIFKHYVERIPVRQSSEG